MTQRRSEYSEKEVHLSLASVNLLGLPLESNYLRLRLTI
jgi:hypothetical protein